MRGTSHQLGNPCMVGKTTPKAGVLFPLKVLSAFEANPFCWRTAQYCFGLPLCLDSCHIKDVSYFNCVLETWKMWLM